MNPSSKIKKTLSKYIVIDKSVIDKPVIDKSIAVEKSSIPLDKRKAETVPVTEIYIPDKDRAKDSKSSEDTMSDHSDSKKVTPTSHKTDTKSSIDIKKDIDDIKPREKIDELKESIVRNGYYNPLLNTDFDTLHINPTGKSYIVIYRINTTGLKPFLEFCLYKYPTYEDQKYKTFSDLLVFPTIKHTDLDLTSSSTLKTGINSFVNTNFGLPIDCEGFKIFNNKYYFFFNVMDYNEEPKILKRSDMWWWCVLDEIVNNKRVTNFPIYKDVYNLFLQNPDCIYLYDRENNIIEIPSIGYHGTYYGLLDIISTIGLQPSTINAMMGPYYYFGTFRKAVRYAGWTSTYTSRSIDGEQIADENGKYEKGGILRYVMFLGNMKTLLNQPSDSDDYSDLVKERIRKNNRAKNYEMMTIKLHDHNGKWIDEYDSIYVGRATITDGRKRKLFMKNPEFVVKYFNQFTLLSTHILDKNTLKEKWDGNYSEYQIE